MLVVQDEESNLRHQRAHRYHPGRSRKLPVCLVAFSSVTEAAERLSEMHTQYCDFV